MLARVARGDVVESVHRGHVAVVDTHGRLIGGIGHPDVLCYPRSALKPVQAAAVAEIVADAGLVLDSRSWAIAAASHTGTDDHQIEAARLLATTEADEEALRCPAAWPADFAALRAADEPTSLAHNCSGKHAALLLAQRLLGQPLESYLEVSAPLQRRVQWLLESLVGAPLAPPAVDGCGAPAWLLPLDRVAYTFAQAASGEATERTHIALLRSIGTAMRLHPELVGGQDLDDTLFMRANSEVVAKRGAEAVFAAGTAAGIGVAVKISDGGTRAVRPVVAALLQALGHNVDDDWLQPPVFGGQEQHGAITVAQPVAELADLLTSVS